MSDDDTATGDQTAGEDKTDTTVAFTPEALSPEAKEYIRKTVQAESDRKTTAALRKFQSEQADIMRTASTRAEQEEFNRLADEQKFDEIGRRVVSQRATQGLEESVILRTAETIEANIEQKFADVLGVGAVEEIKAEVLAKGGAHAEFALALAGAVAGKTRAEEIQSEVRAQLVAAGLAKREEDAGASKVASGGAGTKLTTFEEVELAYGRGEASEETYLAAKAARQTKA